MRLTSCSQAELRKYLAQANDVLTEVTQEVEDRVTQDGRVFLRWVHKGVNGVTGKSYAFPGCTFIRISGGWVVEHRDYFDSHVLVKQFTKAAEQRKGKSRL